MPGDKDNAYVWIKDAADMTTEERHEMADWLRQHADDLERDGTQYANNFTGHYKLPRNRTMGLPGGRDSI